MQAPSSLLAELNTLLGPAGVVTNAQDAQPYLNDWWGKSKGHALAIVRPADTGQVAAVVQLCARAGVAIVPQGGNTGLCGGATPPGGDAPCVVMALSRMNRVRGLDPYNQTITVDAGCTLAAVQDAAANADRLFPLSLGSEGTCQIGGNVSTNAGGTAVLRYGNMRDLVLGIEAVLPDGTIWNGLRGLRKDNTGYDLKQLFIGAEGTLGIVTGAVLKLFPRPAAHATAWAALKTLDQAPRLLALARSVCGERITSFEVCSRSQLDLVYRHVADTRDPLNGQGEWVAMIELADMRDAQALQELLEAAMGQALEDGIADDVAIAASQAQSDAIWRIRHSVSEANVREGHSVSHDISVPLSAIGDFTRQADEALAPLREGGSRLVVGHVGDGNLHYILLFPHAVWEALPAGQRADRAAAITAIVQRTALSLGGSISAEHGIGVAHREELRHAKPAAELAMMRAVKRALDPQGLMNPGKLL
ncbi:FAD dependent oxidase [Bordetella ansorpii]|uniref:FAD dependent oxidase n=1 Tax=Bordetella ansorpii TaxID=288768 RepID=A0A157RCU3_9BORD|nr:FAD-binding oxidoreductase [Bordetella ansorpii]SAI55696.1 FAD dependent oxidase [Bordetella ansorpii]